MSGEKPVGDAAAVLDGEETHAVFVDLGPVWLTEKGNLTFTMHAEPLAWRDAGAPRRVVIRPRKGVAIVVNRVNDGSR